jgi:hypothetical protein
MTKILITKNLHLSSHFSARIQHLATPVWIVYQWSLLLQRVKTHTHRGICFRFPQRRGA